MANIQETFQRELGKPAIQITAVASTLVFAVAAFFLGDVEQTASFVTWCLAAASLVVFCVSIWFKRVSEQREKEAELKRRAAAERHAEKTKPKSDVMGEGTLKVLRFFFYNENDLSLEDIKLAFKLDTNTALNEVEDLQKRGFLRQTTIAGIGKDAACYKLTDSGRTYALKNMFA